MKTLYKSILGVLTLMMLLFTFSSCSEDSPKSDLSHQQPDPVAPVIDRTAFPLGADVSWLTQLENEGKTFSGADGVQKECMTLLRDTCGVNSIRLRVWVNPAEGYCNLGDVVLKAYRATQLGMRVMIDFHFSDDWADPSKQTTPKAWEEYDIDQMKEAVTKHVTEVLGKLKELNITPEWVQIGNEVNNGMLWPLAKVSNTGGPQNFAALVTAGYDAVKAIDASIKVIVHIAADNKKSRYDYIFGSLKNNGAAEKYDLIGISLYPDNPSVTSLSIEEYMNEAYTNIQYGKNTYGKDVMICEFGMNYEAAAKCNEVITDILNKQKAGAPIAGIFYWEPECPPGYNGGYSYGAFNAKGQPTEALKAYCKY